MRSTQRHHIVAIVVTFVILHRPVLTVLICAPRGLGQMIIRYWLIGPSHLFFYSVLGCLLYIAASRSVCVYPIVTVD